VLHLYSFLINKIIKYHEILASILLMIGCVVEGRNLTHDPITA